VTIAEPRAPFEPKIRAVFSLVAVVDVDVVEYEYEYECECEYKAHSLRVV